MLLGLGISPLQLPSIVISDTAGGFIGGLNPSDQFGHAVSSIGDFYAGFFSIVNLAGLLIQLFLVSRIVKWFGVNRALMVLPLVALGRAAPHESGPVRRIGCDFAGNSGIAGA